MKFQKIQHVLYNQIKQNIECRNININIKKQKRKAQKNKTNTKLFEANKTHAKTSMTDGQLVSS